jgi:phosphatidylglycerophosphate synthase
MPAQVIGSGTTPEATYKGRELEGVLDLYFYRKVGFRLARLFARVGGTPSAVTLLGGLFGIVAGHLYYYRDLGTNICGMALHVCANTLDNADGQLARLTARQSRSGRILDGLIDYLVFISIYLHLGFRCLGQGVSPAVWLLVFAASASHALQSAAVDYCRNAYLYFVRGMTHAEFDSRAHLLTGYRKLRWREQPGNKFLQWLYLGMTREQEILAPGLHQLGQETRVHLLDGLPEWLGVTYRTAVRPTLRLWRLLMTNTRMLLLFILLFIGRPIWYFWFEVIPCNLLLLYLLLQQQITSKALLKIVMAKKWVA